MEVNKFALISLILKAKVGNLNFEMFDLRLSYFFETGKLMSPFTEMLAVK